MPKKCIQYYCVCLFTYNKSILSYVIKYAILNEFNNLSTIAQRL